MYSPVLDSGLCEPVFETRMPTRIYFELSVGKGLRTNTELYRVAGPNLVELCSRPVRAVNAP